MADEKGTTVNVVARSDSLPHVRQGERIGVQRAIAYSILVIGFALICFGLTDLTPTKHGYESSTMLLGLITMVFGYAKLHIEGTKHD